MFGGHRHSVTHQISVGATPLSSSERLTSIHFAGCTSDPNKNHRGSLLLVVAQVVDVWEQGPREIGAGERLC